MSKWETAERLLRPASQVEVSDIKKERRKPVLRAPIQYKLTVGATHDPAEADADRLATKALTRIAASDVSYPDAAAGRHQIATSAGRIRRAAPLASSVGAEGGAIADSTAQQIEAARGGGHALDPALRGAMETGFGTDFSSVRMHADATADQLNSDLQAKAFTTGSDIFFRAGEYDPSSQSGRHLIAHELAHTLQQADGHVAKSSGPAKVQRLFGGSKKAGGPVVGASGQVEHANGLSTADKAEQKAGYAIRKQLKADILPLESALKKLSKRRRVGSNDDYSAARLLRDKAQSILDLLPAGPTGRAAQKVLGSQYEDERKRLRYLVGEAQLIYDEYLVSMTKKKAGNIYMDAGRKAAKKDVPAEKGGFANLTDKAGELGFAELSAPTNAGDVDIRLRIREAGADLGLSPAEIAAILTFTTEDYKYINPATANSDSWMKNANANKINALNPDNKDELRKSFKIVKLGNARERYNENVAKILPALKEEGALHAGMAMQAFGKMPVWTGAVYRGEVLSQADFDAKFETLVPESKFRAKNKTLTRTAISSSSKNRGIATNFWFIAGPGVPDPKVSLLWEMQLINGRDIEKMSATGFEREVATLPGAQFSINSVEWEDGHVLVKCTQTK